jgi:molybdenum cofactor synthesis domain-containing protein
MATKIEKASVLAIGTELTTGQITNRNAAWLSEQLADMGIETVVHETVADDREMIISALERCHSLSGLIFVTGGLGPTTDDFTREVIADWVGKPLKFYEPSWRKIHDRLTRLGVPVAESNRQQAFYPETAEVITNEQGTADAFAVMTQAGEKVAGYLFVLPGPPREVESVWQSGIQARVRALVPHLKPAKLLTWQCIGKSEAELGELTEKALAGSGLKTGYRAHRPYVEVKVWCSDEDMRTKATYLEALEKAIGPWVATRQGKDLAEKLLGLLSRADEVEIADACSGGILAERLGAFLREPSHRSQADSVIVTTEWMAPNEPELWIRQVLNEADDSTLTLAIAGLNSAGEWAFGLREGPLVHVESGQSPYRRIELLDRARRHAVELALKRWSEWLAASIQ